MPLSQPCPSAPDWVADFEAFERMIPALSTLAACPGDPVHHAEGDVGSHTRLVLASMAALPAYRALDDHERQVVTLACLLHDIAKPATLQQLEGGRIGHPGHARKGTRMARKVLWELGVPFAMREQVCALIRHHEVPFFAIERDKPRDEAVRVSTTARCDLLSIVAEADALGRQCQDQSRLLDNVALFRELCEESDCLRGPYPFPDDHTRVAYFLWGHQPPNARRFDDTKCEVVVMSGLPGSGKDGWLTTHMPDADVISLDAIRKAMGVLPSDDQGKVVSAAREAARERLREARGFVWNATNVSRELRDVAVGLALRYGARVRIVYVEVPHAQLRRQNRSRDAVVPDAVLEKLLHRWDVPDATEAHAVDYVTGE